MNEASDNPLIDRLKRLFGDGPCKLQVAALPWRDGQFGLEILLISSRDTGRWVLPKGWIERDEKQWHAAEREAEEEAGLSGEISRTDAGRYFYAKVQRIGPAVPCEVVVYPLAVKKLADKWREKDVRQRQWFTAEEAASRVEEPDLAALIRRFGDRAAVSSVG